MAGLPSVLENLISEYKEGSFRISQEQTILNFVTNEVNHLKVYKVRSLSFPLKKGVWHYTMSPFTRQYVNFHSPDEGKIGVGGYSLARCYSLIFHHSEYSLQDLPRNLSVPQFSPQREDAFVTDLVLCSAVGLPLLNLVFNDYPAEIATLVVPSEELYSDADGNFLVIPVAEIDPHAQSIHYTFEGRTDEHMNKKLEEAIKKVIKVEENHLLFAFVHVDNPSIDELHISVKEAKKHGLPVRDGDKEVILWVEEYKNGLPQFVFFDGSTSMTLNQKNYPILRKLATVLSRFTMKSLKDNAIFDSLYRKHLLEEEANEISLDFYNNRPQKGEATNPDDVEDADDVDYSEGDDENNDESSSEDEGDDVKSNGLIFEGLVFAISGKLSQSQSEINKLIGTNGGQLRSSVTKDVNIVIANAIGSGKTEKARAEGKKIIAEKWLHDSIKKGKRLPFDEYSLT